MPARKIIPGDRELKQLVDRGMTHKQIADYVSEREGVRVTRSAISTALHRAGLTGEYKPHADVIPWRVRIEHNHHYDLRMLRTVARIDRGEDVGPDSYARAQSWKRRLIELDAVVHYDPTRPDGFALVKRPRGVDGWIYPPELAEARAKASNRSAAGSRKG